jgi:hypothetical protein
MAVLITQGKLLQHLREISPATRRVAVVRNDQRGLLGADREAA